MKKGKGRGNSPFGYLTLVFVLTGAVLALAFCSSRHKEAQAPVGGGSAAPANAFEAELRARAPVFMQIKRQCPVDNTEFIVPSQDKLHDNILGGWATDLMKIALAPPRDGHGPPELDCQQFDHLLGTCPTCGATYIELDLINMKSGLPREALSNLNKFWNIERVAPQLHAIPQEKWTYDQRAFARYLTARSAWEGAPQMQVELGFAALQGAYCSNMSVYLGRDYTIPSAAFYALAAAHFDRAITADSSLPGTQQMVPQGKAEACITLGEISRLLGRREESLAALAQARSILTADLENMRKLAGRDEQSAKHYGQAIVQEEFDLKVAQSIEDYVNAGNFDLQRVQSSKNDAPPIGWTLDMMLPAINGELAVRRAEWTGMHDPAELATAMLALVSPATAGEPAAEAAPK